MTSRDENQQKAFLRWVNICIGKHPKGLEKVQNLVESIRDGLTLGRLAEVLLHTTLRMKEPVKNELQRTQNISLALDAIEKSGCKLINIHPAAIVRGDTKTVLGLMFQLCIHFQVSSPQVEQQQEEDGTEKKEAKKQLSVVQLKQHLLDWINAQLETLRPEENLALRALTSADVYTEEALVCTDLENGLRDGGVLVALIASLSGQAGLTVIETIQADVDQSLSLTIDQLKEENIINPTSTVDLSNDKIRNYIITQSIGMRHASTLLDIPQLIDGEDMVLTPDSNTALAYYSYFKNFIRPEEPLIIVPALKRQTSQIMTGELNNTAHSVAFPEFGSNVVTLETFNPQKDYPDDIVLYL